MATSTGPPRAASPVHLVEMALEFRPDLFDSIDTRKALRLCCRRLCQAVDGSKPFTALRLTEGAVSNAFWASRLLLFCKTVEVSLVLDTIADANATITALATAPLPGLTRLVLFINVRQHPAEGAGNLSSWDAATWTTQLESLSLRFNFPIDFGVFDLLALPDLAEVRMSGCAGENTAALWRCMTERSGNVCLLELEDVEVPEELLSGFFAAKADHLEVICLKVEEFELDLAGVAALATAALPRLEELHMTPLLGPEEINLAHAPWTKNVQVLSSDAATSEGLHAFLLGARGGHLRKLRLDMEEFNDPFVGAELPALTEVDITAIPPIQVPWQVDGLFASTSLLALESVSLYSCASPLILEDSFANESALPALKRLKLEDFRMDGTTAAAIGKRLPRLTSFWLETEDSFDDMNVLTLLSAAGSYGDEWATERLTLRSHLRSTLGANKDLHVLIHLIRVVAPRMARIKTLDFYGDMVGVLGANLWTEAALAGMWPRLEMLRVGKVGDEGLKALAGSLGGWKELKKLRIYSDTDQTEFDTAAAFPGVADVRIRQP